MGKVTMSKEAQTIDNLRKAIRTFQKEKDCTMNCKDCILGTDTELWMGERGPKATACLLLKEVGVMIGV